MNKTSALTSDFEAKCRAASLKVTPQRLEVYRVLFSTDSHPSADAVYRQVRKKIPHISLDTVNRTLNSFVEHGLAFTVEGTGSPKRFDADLTAHQHFKCISCKKIIDFRHEPFNNIDIPKSLPDGCRILRKTVYFEGFCQACSENPKS